MTGGQPFSFHDEERDIEAFRTYLETLTPDALEDVLRHLDADRFPRRHEAVLREATRRHVFFVSPYSRFEHQVRVFCFSVFGLIALALVLRIVGSFPITLHPGERLPFFLDLAAGGPKAARLVFAALRLLVFPATLAALFVAFVSLWWWHKRRVRAEVVALTWLTALLAIVFASLGGTRVL